MSLAQDYTVAAPPCELIGLAGAPVVVVLGGISADRHVCAHAGNPLPGWWEGVAGDAGALDTTRFQLFGCDYVDGGSSADGRADRAVSTRDQAAAVAQALENAGIDRVHAVVGASYGGMVALAFAELFPERLERLVVIGAAHRSHPMITALRAIQRRVVELGLATGRAHDALVLARALAVTTYRTAREFETRFDLTPIVTANDVIFPVESYLLRHGERFAARFTPARFLALSLSSDLHSVDPARITTPATLVAIEGDTIVPREQVEQLARDLGAPARLVDLPSDKGHDGFLTEAAALNPILHAALS